MMAFQELMSKHNLLGGRYSVPPTCPPSPPPTASTTTSPSPARTSPSPSAKRRRTNFVASVLPKNNRIHTNTGFMLIEERDPETNENVDSPSSQDDFGDLMAKITKQRRMVERLKDPIVVKTQNRKRKTNLNAFKSKFLTLKKKIGALQMLKSSCCWSKIIYRIPQWQSQAKWQGNICVMEVEKFQTSSCVSEVPENRECTKLPSVP